MLIFWDIDNTLVDYNESEKNAILQILMKEDARVNKEEITDIWRGISKNYFNEFLNGNITFEEQGSLRMIEIFQQICNQKISMQQAADLFFEYRCFLEKSWVLFDDVLPCLKNLKGIQMGIISNGQKKQQQKKLKYLGIQKFFDLQFYADEMGIKKPNPDMFLKAIKNSNVRKEEVWYIGDDLNDDIYPCMEIGIKCIWIDREKTNINSINNHALNIYSLSQVKFLDGCIALAR